ncbi:hypothetical protein PRIPAC_91464 [Pristionchus pacificus]|uniref:Uncharacterized protein n=1 Tax=Pristionchus pacificus TaxID=54126 RepID=A0A2A6CH35_PRIPA|nr:hypothetical protein PRIPAC_91464 [Pristionchus pacificus]|eukprot:PDM77331.1 hypothetical protein PRIPAC_35531 [Pristionchus pacificus]
MIRSLVLVLLYTEIAASFDVKIANNCLSIKTRTVRDLVLQRKSQVKKARSAIAFIIPMSIANCSSAPEMRMEAREQKVFSSASLDDWGRAV